VSLNIVFFLFDLLMQLIRLLFPFMSFLIEQKMLFFELFYLFAVSFAVAQTLCQFLFEGQHSLGWLTELAA